MKLKLFKEKANEKRIRISFRNYLELCGTIYDLCELATDFRFTIEIWNEGRVPLDLILVVLSQYIKNIQSLLIYKLEITA